MSKPKARVSPTGMRAFAKQVILQVKDNPPPEPSNLRDVLFYNNLPQIMRWLADQNIDMAEYDRTHKKNFANAFYSTLSSVMSEMVLDGELTYAELGIMEEERIKDEATDPEHKVGILFEKQGLHPALKPIKAGLNISLWSCKGFHSTNSLEQLTARLRENPLGTLFILSDYDPSGLEIAADLERRARRLGIRTKFVRIGVSPEDIPPEKRVMSLVQLKETDSRTKNFVRLHGRTAYEVQALNPQEIRELVLRKLIEYGLDLNLSVARRLKEDQAWLSRSITERLLLTLKNSIRRAALGKVQQYDTRRPTVEQLKQSIISAGGFLRDTGGLEQRIAQELRTEYHLTDEDDDE